MFLAGNGVSFVGSLIGGGMLAVCLLACVMKCWMTRLLWS